MSEDPRIEHWETLDVGEVDVHHAADVTAGEAREGRRVAEGIHLGDLDEIGEAIAVRILTLDREDRQIRTVIAALVAAASEQAFRMKLVYHILRAAGLKVGMVSTLNAVVPGRRGDNEVQSTGLHVTTPDAPEVQHYLAQMVAAGTSHGRRSAGSPCPAGEQGGAGRLGGGVHGCGGREWRGDPADR